MSENNKKEEEDEETYESPPRTKIGKNISTTATPLRTSPITPGSKVRKNLNLESKKPLFQVLSEKKRLKQGSKTKSGTPLVQKPPKSTLKDRQKIKTKTHLKELYSLIRRKTGKGV